MVAKIGKGENMIGALSYNQLKVDGKNGQVLFTNKIPEAPDNSYSVSYLYRYFEPYLLANNKTEKLIRHISLNPDPADKVNDEQFRCMAQQYMQEMGYGNQPFVVYKHTDIERTHIHIVTTCVKLDGKKIPDSYDRPRSMAICRKLEQQYKLIPATKKQHADTREIFRPVDYRTGDLKKQIAAVVRYVPKHYQFQTMGEYNALLSLFNITAEKVEGELHGQHRRGLVYFALDEDGRKTSNPLKASMFGKYAGYAQLEKHMETSKEKLKSSDAKPLVRQAVVDALQSADGEADFRKRLSKQGINVVVRRNDTGRIYGITFIDHRSRTVWNGSRFGKECSAGVFHDCWNNGKVPVGKTTQADIPMSEAVVSPQTEKPHELFDFLGDHVPEAGHEIMEALIGIGWLLPEAQGEDYEEQEFAYRMKKRKKKRKR